jgi:hypothetical protein
VGRDDVHCWVQWAISQSNGFGFGFMGQSSLPTNPNIADTTTGPSSNNTPFILESSSNQQLEYVREKLVAVDKKLQKKFEDDRKYQPGDRETVLVLNAVLSKVCAQLVQRKDCGLHVKKMEELLKAITANSDKPVHQAGVSAAASSTKPTLKTTVYDPALAALVKRFRLDFEEWDTSEDMMSTARKKVNRYMEALRIAKEYVHEAEESCDLLLMRDSIKKICNLYMEIVKAPLVDNPKGAPAVSKAATTRPSSPDGDNNDEHNDEDAAPTASQLAKFSEEAIEEYETEDPLWVKRFGKLRALHFAARLVHMQVQ